MPTVWIRSDLLPLLIACVCGLVAATGNAQMLKAFPAAESHKVSLRMPSYYVIDDGEKAPIAGFVQLYRGEKVYFPIMIENFGNAASTGLVLRYDLHAHRTDEDTWETVNIPPLQPGETWTRTFTVRFYRSGDKIVNFLLRAEDGGDLIRAVGAKPDPELHVTRYFEASMH